MNGKLEVGCETVVGWTKLRPMTPSGGVALGRLPPSGGTKVVCDGPAPPWVVWATDGVGIGIPIVGIGVVRGTVDGGPMEGIPKVSVVTGVVVDGPPAISTKMGVEVTPAMGLVGAV